MNMCCIQKKSDWIKVLGSFLISIASNILVDFIPAMKHKNPKKNKIIANDISGNIYQDVRIRSNNKKKKKNYIKAKSINGSIYQDSDVLNEQVFSHYDANTKRALCSGEKTNCKLKK